MNSTKVRQYNPDKKRNDEYCGDCGTLLRPCAVCNKKFERNGNWIVCSPECQKIYLKKYISVYNIRRYQKPRIIQRANCIICNIKFIKNKYTPNQKTCSTKCHFINGDNKSRKWAKDNEQKVRKHKRKSYLRKRRIKNEKSKSIMGV